MSSITAINPATHSAIPAATQPTSSASTTSSNSSQTLTQQDFLKIMVAQFTQQDPLASGDGSSSGSGTSDYVNLVMAMTNLTTMQTMSGQQAQQLAETLPGSTISLTDANGNAVSGVVQSTQINNGSLYLTVNGSQYLSTELTGVTATAGQTAAAAASSTTTTTTP